MREASCTEVVETKMSAVSSLLFNKQHEMVTYGVVLCFTYYTF